eukprot:9489382-Pyramimonas_sp.AAC.2
MTNETQPATCTHVPPVPHLLASPRPRLQKNLREPRPPFASDLCLRIRPLPSHQASALASGLCLGVRPMPWRQASALASGLCLSVRPLPSRQASAFASGLCLNTTEGGGSGAEVPEPPSPLLHNKTQAHPAQSQSLQRNIHLTRRPIAVPQSEYKRNAHFQRRLGALLRERRPCFTFPAARPE